MKPTFVTASALALNFAAQPAHAAPADDGPVTETVSFADLDLSSRSDQAKLEKRVRSTIGRLCPGDNGASPASPSPDPTCFRVKLKDARAQMDRAIARANGGALFASAPPSAPHR